MPEPDSFSIVLLWQLSGTVDSAYIKDPRGPNHSHIADLPDCCSYRLWLFFFFLIHTVHSEFTSFLHASASYSLFLLCGVCLSHLQALFCLLFSCDVHRLLSHSFFYFLLFFLPQCQALSFICFSRFKLSGLFSFTSGCSVLTWFSFYIFGLWKLRGSFRSCKAEKENTPVQVHITVNHSE